MQKSGKPSPKVLAQTVPIPNGKRKTGGNAVTFGLQAQDNETIQVQNTAGVPRQLCPAPFVLMT